MQAESDESIEGFRSVGEPVEAARMTSFAEPVEAAKLTSYPKCPTVDSILVSISPPTDISASVFGRGSDEEFELVASLNIETEYAMLYKKIMEARSDESLEGFGSVKEPVEAARMTSSASSGEPIEAVKATSFVEPVEAARPTASSSSAEHVQAARLTSISSPIDTSTRVSGGESDEELEFVDNFHIPKGYTVWCKKTMKAEPDESLEGFGSVGKPVEAARMTSSAFSDEPVEAAKTTTSAEPVEAAKTTSSAKCPTVGSKLVSTSSPKHISAPFVRSTSVPGPGSDEKFEFVDNFKIPKEYAVLYRKIFGKYGHMATKRVIKSNDTILVACVSSLLEMISTMETTRGAALSESLPQTWEGDIEDVENLGFKIKWLRNKFDEAKNNWKSSSGIHNDVEIHKKELDATQVKYAGLLARKEELHQEISKVIMEIREAEAKISSEKKTIQEKLAPENNFLDGPILGKLLS
ncbi:uncharacterized protein LOC113335680 [Papaver somniferum]|uniref:uncharacterized protein LOC113335680 n=1 Tax=Papaver somniferum TaxID=3469 RepID=UPI000E6F7615|nr:uncharacterized protein LOC113335680 [Papaver somniferum]XP_026437482.1 uncharacterized protein LOC113335680 [Papaver somniferum]XP_026437483.1 uncharacterized protein LOC113335680 [Papaver somniferum]